MKMQGRHFTKEFKLEAIQELESGKKAADICRERDIKQDMLYRWRKEHDRDPGHAFAGKGVPVKEDARNAELERKIGQLYLENEFIKKVNSNLQARLAELKKTR